MPLSSEVFEPRQTCSTNSILGCVTKFNRYKLCVYKPTTLFINQLLCLLIIYLFDFTYSFPYRNVCNYLQIVHLFWGSNCTLISVIAHLFTNQKRVRFKSDESHYRFYYPAWSALAAIIRKWLLLSQLSLLAVAVKVPRWQLRYRNRTKMRRSTALKLYMVCWKSQN